MINIPKTKILILSACLAGFFGLANLASAANSSFSLSVWVKPSTSVASKAIMGKAEEMRVATDATGHPLCQVKSSTWRTAVVSATAITVNQWSNVTCSYDLVNLKIYVNGLLAGTQALTTSIDDTTAVWKLGHDDSASSPYGYYTGLIDDYKFYTYTLGDDEIKTLYNDSKSVVMGDDSSRDNNGTTVTGANKDYCIPGDTAQCDKPVGEWKMDEKTGTTAYDTSGNGDNGVISGATWDSGKFGNSLKFKMGDYVDMGDLNNLTEGKAALTVSAWVKPTNNNCSISNCIFAEKQTQTFMLWWDNTQNIAFRTYNASGSSASGVFTGGIKDTNWHYVTGVYDGTNVSVYVDGKKGSMVGSLTGLTQSGTNTMRLGRSSGGWDGSIDNMTIYDYARTPAQIAWDFNRGKPIAEWRMDEGTGTTVHDESGNGNTGTLTNMDAATDWVTGKFGKALDFDGVNDYVGNIRVPIRTLGKGEHSISLWFKTNSLSSGPMVMFGNGNGSNGSYEGDGQIGWRSTTGNLAASVYNSSGSHQPVTASKTYRDGAWHYLSMVLDYNSLKLYVDGEFIVQNASVNSISAQVYSSDPYLIVGARTMDTGSDIDNISYFSGELDQINVYNYALTSEQIKKAYNAGAVRF